eukprot:TRINITY_DN11827_c0_g1_i1.p1 TRINITY_DN11827_c0_g1~~TRINITY_DN11827_c0_g1_i1.p1  ORF type:complete len:1891 (+),score=492.77 TRINITY_DN11827_c0_g1_i1:85-5673(+)
MRGEGYVSDQGLAAQQAQQLQAQQLQAHAQEWQGGQAPQHQAGPPGARAPADHAAPASAGPQAAHALPGNGGCAQAEHGAAQPFQGYHDQGAYPDHGTYHDQGAYHDPAHAHVQYADAYGRPDEGYVEHPDAHVEPPGQGAAPRSHGLPDGPRREALENAIALAAGGAAVETVPNPHVLPAPCDPRPLPLAGESARGVVISDGGLTVHPNEDGSGEVLARLLYAHVVEVHFINEYRCAYVSSADIMEGGQPRGVGYVQLRADASGSDTLFVAHDLPRSTRPWVDSNTGVGSFWPLTGAGLSADGIGAVFEQVGMRTILTSVTPGSPAAAAGAAEFLGWELTHLKAEPNQGAVWAAQVFQEARRCPHPHHFEVAMRRCDLSEDLKPVYADAVRRGSTIDCTENGSPRAGGCLTMIIGGAIDQAHGMAFASDPGCARVVQVGELSQAGVAGGQRFVGHQLTHCADQEGGVIEIRDGEHARQVLDALQQSPQATLVALHFKGPIGPPPGAADPRHHQCGTAGRFTPIWIGECRGQAPSPTVVHVEDTINGAGDSRSPVRCPLMPLLDPAHDIPPANGLRCCCEEFQPGATVLEFPGDLTLWQNLTAQCPLCDGAMEEPLRCIVGSHDMQTQHTMNEDFIRSFVHLWQRYNCHLVTVAASDGERNFFAYDEFWQAALGARLTDADDASGGIVQLTSSQSADYPVALSVARWEALCAHWEAQRDCTAARQQAKLLSWQREVQEGVIPRHSLKYAYRGSPEALSLAALMPLFDPVHVDEHHQVLLRAYTLPETSWGENNPAVPAAADQPLWDNMLALLPQLPNVDEEPLVAICNAVSGAGPRRVMNMLVMEAFSQAWKSVNPYLIAVETEDIYTVFYSTADFFNSIIVPMSMASNGQGDVLVSSPNTKSLQPFTVSHSDWLEAIKLWEHEWRCAKPHLQHRRKVLEAESMRLPRPADVARRQSSIATAAASRGLRSGVPLTGRPAYDPAAAEAAAGADGLGSPGALPPPQLQQQQQWAPQGQRGGLVHELQPQAPLPEHAAGGDAPDPRDQVFRPGDFIRSQMDFFISDNQHTELPRNSIGRVAGLRAGGVVVEFNGLSGHQFIVPEMYGAFEKITAATAAGALGGITINACAVINSQWYHVTLIRPPEQSTPQELMPVLEEAFREDLEHDAQQRGGRAPEFAVRQLMIWDEHSASWADVTGYSDPLPDDAQVFVGDSAPPPPPAITQVPGELSPGHRIECRAACATDSAESCELSVGQRGTVMHVTAAGDAVVEFDDISHRQWLTRAKFCHFDVMRLAPAQVYVWQAAGVECEVAGVYDITDYARDDRPVWKRQPVTGGEERFVYYSSTRGQWFVGPTVCDRGLDSLVSSAVCPAGLRGWHKGTLVSAYLMVLERGDRVEVREQFLSDSVPPIPLAMGLRGTAVHRDEEGDVLVEFDGVVQRQWVMSRNFRKLELVHPTGDAACWAPVTAHPDEPNPTDRRPGTAAAHTAPSGPCRATDVTPSDVDVGDALMNAQQDWLRKKGRHATPTPESDWVSGTPVREGAWRAADQALSPHRQRPPISGPPPPGPAVQPAKRVRLPRLQAARGAPEKRPRGRRRSGNGSATETASSYMDEDVRLHAFAACLAQQRAYIDRLENLCLSTGLPIPGRSRFLAETYTASGAAEVLQVAQEPPVHSEVAPGSAGTSGRFARFQPRTPGALRQSRQYSTSGHWPRLTAAGSGGPPQPLQCYALRGDGGGQAEYTKRTLYADVLEDSSVMLTLRGDTDFARRAMDCADRMPLVDVQYFGSLGAPPGAAANELLSSGLGLYCAGRTAAWQLVAADASLLRAWMTWVWRVLPAVQDGPFQHPLPLVPTLASTSPGGVSRRT